MAKNYTIAEAVQVIVENEDAAQITELGRRYPLLVSKLTYLAAKAGEEFNDFMKFMPENLSANKINQSIKRALEEDGEEAEGEDFEDDGDEAPKKAGKQVKKDAEPDEATDYENWNNARMYKRLGELGARKKCKEMFGDLSHDSMLQYLQKYGAGTPDDEDVEDEAEAPAEETPSYEGMNAVKLYKLCRERKIKAEQKKPAKYYIALLKKADEEAAKVEDEAEDEDWDEEDEAEEEAPAPKKPGRPANKPAATKPQVVKGGKKAAAPKEEDDEDWDI